MSATEACLITTAAQATRFVSSGIYSDAAPAAHVGSQVETAQQLIEKPTGSSTGAFRVKPETSKQEHYIIQWNYNYVSAC